jgi:menaquinone-dependent protoporphyrinogen oxidase
MKTLILYATKYGATSEIADRIAARLESVVLRDLKRDGRYDAAILKDFDCVVIGGSLYAGMLRKEAKKYVSENAAALAQKRLGLFLSGMSQNHEDSQQAFAENFPPSVLQSAKSIAFLGGIFDPAKAKGVDKFIFRAVTKQRDYANTISDERIDVFVRELLK